LLLQSTSPRQHHFSMSDTRTNGRAFGEWLSLLVLACATNCDSGQSVRPNSDSSATQDGPAVGSPDASPDLGGDTKPPADTTTSDSLLADAAGGQDAVLLGDARGRKANVTCSLVEGDPSMCQCVSGTLGPNDPLCTPDSVAPEEGQIGICCNDSFECVCRGYRCVVASANGTCVCGPSGATWLPSGTEVSECPAPGDSEHCCLKAAMHMCSCGPASCYGSTEVEVSGCSTSSIVECDLGEKSVSSCS